MVRYKHRYFAVEIIPDDQPAHAPLVLNKAAIYAAVIRAVQNLHGDFGVGALIGGLTTKYCNPYTKVALIRARHGPHRFLATALPFIKVIDRISVHVRIIKVGATILQCLKYIKNYQICQLERYWNLMKTDKDRQLLKASLMDLSTLTADK